MNNPQNDTTDWERLNDFDLYSISAADDRIDLDELRTQVDDLEQEIRDDVSDYNSGCKSNRPNELIEFEEHPSHETWSTANDFCNEADGYCDGSVISEDTFTDHAREMAEDCISADFDSWPMTCIDWDDAAEELKQDYTEFDFDGFTVYGR